MMIEEHSGVAFDINVVSVFARVRGKERAAKIG
jgi:hypothetical protein